MYLMGTHLSSLARLGSPPPSLFPHTTLLTVAFSLAVPLCQIPNPRYTHTICGRSSHSSSSTKPRFPIDTREKSHISLSSEMELLTHLQSLYSSTTYYSLPLTTDVFSDFPTETNSLVAGGGDDDA